MLWCVVLSSAQAWGFQRQHGNKVDNTFEQIYNFDDNMDKTRWTLMSCKTKGLDRQTLDGRCFRSLSFGNIILWIISRPRVVCPSGWYYEPIKDSAGFSHISCTSTISATRLAIVVISAMAEDELAKRNVVVHKRAAPPPICFNTLHQTCVLAWAVNTNMWSWRVVSPSLCHGEREREREREREKGPFLRLNRHKHGLSLISSGDPVSFLSSLAGPRTHRAVLWLSWKRGQLLGESLTSAAWRGLCM